MVGSAWSASVLAHPEHPNAVSTALGPATRDRTDLSLGIDWVCGTRGLLLSARCPSWCVNNPRLATQTPRSSRLLHRPRSNSADRRASARLHSEIRWSAAHDVTRPGVDSPWCSKSRGRVGPQPRRSAVNTWKCSVELTLRT